LTAALPSTTDVFIIGAGPAGLVLGRELQGRGIPFLIVERGATAGESWRRMPTRLNLISPWKANWLTGPGQQRWPRHAVVTRAEYFQYLQDYAKELRLPVHTGVEVQRVERDADGGFQCVTSVGTCRSRRVVSATGYFHHPFTPEIPGRAESSIPQRHVADYGDPERARRVMANARDPVLIIGHGLSAGQTMVELVDAGFNVVLSHRSPLRFGSGPFLWWFLFRTFPALERLKLAILGPRARPNAVLMEGGRPRKLIESGMVPTRPAVTRMEGREVIFVDGSRLAPGLILYATGFRPALQHLAALDLSVRPATGLPAMRDMESTQIPGLFFLGLEGARNFRSRFPRGMRHDARLLGEALQRRSGNTP
jgi:putative flavoprotein involved in K+ transport